MRFLKEPDHTHGKIGKIAVVLINLGTPDAPTTSAVRRYLKEFLSDPRVVEVPRMIWWLILNLIILPFRSKQSAAKYASIWTKDGSPLKVHTEKQAVLLKGYLGERGHEVHVTHAMRYGSPNIPTVLQKLKTDGYDRILILPAYPQYSATTTGANADAVFQHYQKIRNMPELRMVRSYHDHDSYIRALRFSIMNHWQSYGRPDKLVMSFHGLPKAFLMRGDPYHCECYKTARLLAEQLGLTKEQYVVTFQSRLGRAEWLQPYTAPTVKALGQQGTKRIDVVCPGFIADCLETLEEIAMEVRDEFLHAGGKEFNYIPCLNESPEWMRGLAEITEQHLIGWPTMMTVSMRDKQKQDAQISRSESKRLGAEH
ncbi:ferrochelatase [Undibacterium sp. RTI2.1]|uniref:ferrochelatase n=1 Tax=unclassified Undibacterium TaxID=2630295 RepID=UPI002AB5D5D9|nr:MULTISPECIES: ferrochelatase [unclassified Undibacterium]MDY7540502.1 ferrochelatase [Undibacterium sp. 5I1]MEB0030616.1 ferrochelatase [Undibacterium sp. RTI2.1]MEB0116556.1 ferrochelatase [Undibacterium sp. RTI2.2]MEB0231639.1 ferrochelatase [Undibacterium sp. 10I3]MEB0259831.1 ferrochelatase [Undibacterium sp. 5I1]